MKMPSAAGNKTIGDHQSTVEKSSSTSHSSQGLTVPEPQKLSDNSNFKDSTFYKMLGVEELKQLHSKFSKPIATQSHISTRALLQQDSIDASSSLISTPALIREEEENDTDRSQSSGRPKHSMNLEEWVNAISSVFGRGNVAEGAVAMFHQMDDEKQKGYVLWGDVLDLLILRMPPNSLHARMRHLSHSGKFRPIQHSRRETIQKVIGVSTGATNVYIMVSKFGHVGIYDEKFRLQRKYDIDIDTDPNADLDVAASDPGWITDGLWMDNSKHAVYTTSLRTMHFYDASASVHYEEYRAFGFKSIPTCLEYFFDEDNPEASSLLLFGDDSGGLTTVVFHQPLNSLFAKDEVDNVQCLFWPDMGKHSEFATINYSASIHKDGILGLKYLPHNNTVVTISRDPNASILIRHIQGKFNPYIFKLSWGVRCFDYKILQSLHILATGSNDKLVRIWNPVVTSRPSSVMTGHKVGINDVKIHAGKRLILSYDKTSVVKVWDLDQGSCFQTLSLLFPSFNVLGKEIEFGKPAFYIDNGSSHIIIATCCEHMTIISVKEDADDDTETRDITEQEIINNPEIPLNPEDDDKQSKEITPDLISGEPISHVNNSSMSALLMSPRGRLPPSNDSESSHSSGWSTVRNTVQNRTRGKLFQQKVLDDDSGYSQFRIFQEQRECNDENSLNVLRVKKYSNNTRMRELARDNMPFMGIEIHGLQEVTIEPGLPHTNSMRQRGIIIETVEDLLSAKFDTNGIGGSEMVSPAGFDRTSEPGETASSTTGSRRSSAATRKVKMELSMPGAGYGRRNSAVDSKGLPMITEKSDTQSVITEASSKD